MRNNYVARAQHIIHLYNEWMMIIIKKNCSQKAYIRARRREMSNSIRSDVSMR